MAKSSTRVIQCVVFEEAVELVCCRKQRTVCRKLRIGRRGGYPSLLEGTPRGLPDSAVSVKDGILKIVLPENTSKMDEVRGE